VNNFLGLNVLGLIKDYIFTREVPPPYVYNKQKTIDMIINKKISVSRFGDGEFDLILNINHPKFQKADEMLSHRLKQIFNSIDDRILICIPDVFEDKKLELLKGKAARHWKRFLMKNRKILYDLFDSKKIYGDALLTRCYMDQKNKDVSKHYFELLKKIWNNRDIVIVEGRFTRFGVGNDLLNNANSVSRILCPEKNAFDKYMEILNVCLTEKNKNVLFLLALGPTASVLAYDLALQGYQAVDIGHLDIEYEWFLNGADRKMEVDNKYVNEANGTIEEENDNLYDIKYENSIQYRIY